MLVQAENLVGPCKQFFFAFYESYGRLNVQTGGVGHGFGNESCRPNLAVNLVYIVFKVRFPMELQTVHLGSRGLRETEPVTIKLVISSVDVWVCREFSVLTRLDIS